MLLEQRVYESMESKLRQGTWEGTGWCRMLKAMLQDLILILKTG